MNKKNREKIRKYKNIMILLIVISFFITSCYSQKIELNKDKKSGKITIDYMMTENEYMLFSMLLTNNIEENIINPAVLINENEFKKEFKSNKFYKLKTVDFGYKRIANKLVYTGFIEINFSDLEKTLYKMNSIMKGMKIEKVEKYFSIVHIIDYNKFDPQLLLFDYIQSLKLDDKNMYNRIMNKSNFKFLIQSDSPIIKNENVKLVNKNNAEYEFNLDYLIKKMKIKYKVGLKNIN